MRGVSSRTMSTYRRPHTRTPARAPIAKFPRRSVPSRLLRHPRAASRDDPLWKAATEHLEHLGLDAAAAEASISEAFGWGSQKYWRKEKFQQDPDPIQVGDNLAFLRSVGFEDRDLKVLIQEFPEFLGCDRKSRLQPNLDYLQEKFFLKDRHRINAILRKPRVMGNTTDCEGDCQGECTRCWSQF